MKKQMKQVQQFQRRMKIDPPEKLGDDLEISVDWVASALIKESMALEKRIGFNTSMKIRRAHLMIEELGEVLLALANGNEVELLDGLADLCYVVLGTAVTFGLPLAEAFEEVHRSNMTKTPNDGDNPRLRSKGPTYVAPDIKKILTSYKK